MTTFKQVIEEIKNNDNLRHMKIPFPVGTTEEGKLIIEDLFSTGNIFIAGVKGSGKTNFINTLITTMIQVKTPQELRLLIVNRTEEETNIYKGIPHLGMPPISDPAMTGQIMNYLRDEMERRYVYFARKNVKDITKYNDVMNRNDEGEKALPYIVLFIEEALNMVKGCVKPEKTMNDIAALSLKAKKAGIFFVVATSNVSNRSISKPEMLSVFPNRIVFDLGTEGVYKDYFGDEFDYRQDWSLGHLYFFSHLGTTPRKLKAIRTPEAEASKTFAETEEDYSTQTLKTYISGNKDVDRDFRKKYLWLISENSRLSKDNRAMMLEMAKKDKEIAELKERLGL